MINHITIKDFAIAADVSLDLKNGMTVLTGETGAGKSILIDAIQYALGARADASMVRHGCERADISISFALKHIPLAEAWLTEHELNASGECILRRTINADGRSKHFINGQLSTQAQVRELGELLVNIHGQHENQRLLQREQQQILLDEFASADTFIKPKNQQKILDQFAHHGELLKRVQNCYRAWQQVHDEILKLKQSEDQSARISLLEYQIQELTKLDLQVNEYADLGVEHKQVANADNLIQQCQQALLLLTENSEANIDQLLNQALHILNTQQELDARLKNAGTLLTEAQIQINEATRELQHYTDHLEVNPERLQIVEQRLSLLHDTARKYKVTPENLMTLLEQLNQELTNLQHADKLIAELAQQLLQLETNYQVAAKALSDSRKKASLQFDKLVSEHIKQLGMPEGEFSVQFEPLNKLSAQGAEKTEFMVSANRGQPLKPLQKVASGGEISRISLAIQVITAQADNTPTLIFDEVDVGIGGGTAEIVGKLLLQLSQKAQVLCITHLPQVAAQGQQHLQISKSTKDNMTVSKLNELSTTERVQEIARMLGGIKMTEHTLAHAKEMLGSV